MRMVSNPQDHITRAIGSQTPSARSKRPLGVTFVALFAILAGFIALAGVVLVFVEPTANAILLSGISLLAALAFFAAGIGLWRLRSWAWWVTVILSILLTISNVLEATVTGTFVFRGSGSTIGNVILIVIYLLIVAYLVTVRQFFGIGHPKGR